MTLKVEIELDSIFPILRLTGSVLLSIIMKALNSLVPSSSFLALECAGSKKVGPAWFPLFAYALQKSHESHYKIIT